MNKKPLVSIVIPTHNRCNILKRAVVSAINQTYQNIEIIVVSDGSQDNTDSVMEELLKQDARLRYYPYAPAQGGNHARNVGIEKSAGEYIAFLDDDDEWYPEKIQKQVAIMEEDDKIGLVCTGVNCIYEGRKNGCLFVPDAEYDSSKKILIKNCVGSTTTVMLRKTVLEKSGLFDEKVVAMQDYDLWIRVCQYTKVGVVKEACLNYYIAFANKQISQYTDKSERATQYLINKYKDLFDTLTIEERNTRFYLFYRALIKKAIKNKEPKIARKYIKIAKKYKNNIHLRFYWIASFLPVAFLFNLQAIKRKREYKRGKYGSNQK